MKPRTLGYMFLLATLSVPARDAGLIQTGSISVTESDDSLKDLHITSRSVATNLFDKHGNVTKTVTLWDFTGDGIPEQSSTNTLRYDHHGNLISSVEEFDAGADGTVDRRTTVIYTNLAGTLRPWLILTDTDADGTIDEISARTYTFDVDGRLAGIVTETDTNADGTVDFLSFESWTYAPAGHELYYTNNSDIYSPGMLEVVAFAHYTLNEGGDPESATWSRYDPNVGMMLHGSLTFVYDKFGNLLQEVDGVWFPGPTGPSLVTTTTTFYYSRWGELVQATSPLSSSLCRRPTKQSE